MRILNNLHFSPALLVLIATIAVEPLACADDFSTRDGGGLVTQVSHNPLNLQSESTLTSPSFVSGQYSPNQSPLNLSEFSPALNGQNVPNSNGFSAPPPPPPLSHSGSSFSSSSSSGGTATPPAFSTSTQGGIKNYDVSDLIADNVLQFGHNIALKLNEFDPQATRSEIFSPLSVMSALSLLTLGARGKSYQELKHLIGLDNYSELANNPSKYHKEFGLMLDDMQHYDVAHAGNNGSPSKRKQAKWRYNNLKRPLQRNRPQSEIEHTINVANGLFVQNGYSLNPDYSQIVHSIYDSELTQLDYQRKSREAREHINDWVNKSTRGKIPQIITGEISRSTNIILASVLYFKAFWETPFFPRSTTEENFYPDGAQGQAIRVQMMATGGIFPYHDAKEYDCRIIGLPYQGNETTMYIIQPNDSSRQKLRSLQNILNAHIINEMIDNMVWKTTVMVFPKMHFTRTMTMKTMLKSLGVNDIFEAAYSDLSLIGAGGSSTASGPTAAAARAPIPVASVHLSRDHTQGGLLNTFTPSTEPAKQQFYDRYNEPALIFSSRFGEIDENMTTHSPPLTKVPPTVKCAVGTTETTKLHRISKRQAPHLLTDRNAQSLANLEANRFNLNSYRSDLFVDEIVHKVDFTVDEQGTEAAAATLTYLHRSGTDVIFRGDTPFLIVIRHDPTKLPLFYGVINRPEL